MRSQCFPTFSRDTPICCGPISHLSRKLNWEANVLGIVFASAPSTIGLPLAKCAQNSKQPVCGAVLFVPCNSCRAKRVGVGRAEALRRSMLALIEKGAPHEAHPAYWAPFVVVGEGAQ